VPFLTTRRALALVSGREAASSHKARKSGTVCTVAFGWLGSAEFAYVLERHGVSAAAAADVRASRSPDAGCSVRSPLEHALDLALQGCMFDVCVYRKVSRVFCICASRLTRPQSCRFPMTKVPTPRAFRETGAPPEFFISVIQVAASAYINNSKVPPQVLRWMMAPGAQCPSCVIITPLAAMCSWALPMQACRCHAVILVRPYCSSASVDVLHMQASCLVTSATSGSAQLRRTRSHAMRRPTCHSLTKSLT
jgi:hypothetical protein